MLLQKQKFGCIFVDLFYSRHRSLKREMEAKQGVKTQGNAADQFPSVALPALQGGQRDDT